MVTYLQQCFPAIFTNHFEPQSLNYDPDMFYSLNASLPPSSIVLTSDITMVVGKLSDAEFTKVFQTLQLQDSRSGGLEKSAKP